MIVNNPHIPLIDVEPPEFITVETPKRNSMKTQTKGIIGLILIIGGAIALLICGRWLLEEIVAISNAITTPQSILIGSVLIAITLKPRKGK